MYLIIVTSAQGREYLLALHTDKGEADAEAIALVRKWAAVRVEGPRDAITLHGVLADRWS